MIDCFRCKGSAEHKEKTYVVTLDKCVIIIKNAPALVCRQCGETYFEDNVMQNLECIIDNLESMVREVAIVEYFDTAA